MHNVEGGYENDCSVARLAYNRYMLMSPSIQQMRSFTWVKHHLPEDGSVFLQVLSIENTVTNVIFGNFINHSILNLFSEQIEYTNFSIIHVQSSGDVNTIASSFFFYLAI